MVPAPTAERTGEKTAPIPPQETPPPPTSDGGMSSADRLLSSIGARTRGRTGRTVQPDAGAVPLGRGPETAPSKPAETKPAETRREFFDDILAEMIEPAEKTPSKPAEVMKPTKKTPTKLAEVVKPAEKTPSKPGKVVKPVEKVPGESTKVTKPVANVAGQAKTLGTSDGKKTVTQPIQEVAKTGTRPELGLTGPRKQQ